MLFRKNRKLRPKRLRALESLENRQVMAADAIPQLAGDPTLVHPAIEQIGMDLNLEMEAIPDIGPILPLNPVVGTWTNVDPNTGGITKIKITNGVGGHQIQAWGACTPTDCDWGKTSLHLLGTNVSDSVPDYAIGAWDHGFKDTTLTLDMTGDGMVADVYNAFKDDSGRQDYHKRYLLTDDGDMMAMADFGNNDLADVLVGGWVNADQYTGGLTKLAISADASGVDLRAWGQCSPTDCDWGTVPMDLVGSSISDETPEYATANYEFDFKTTFVTTRFDSGDLVVATYNVFTDDSDRYNYHNEYRFWKLGDANHDGEFDSSDLVDVFQAGEYEDGVPGNSTWEEGDFNRDGDFDSSDLIEAFQYGGYESVPVTDIINPPLRLVPLPKFDPSIRFQGIAGVVDDLFQDDRIDRDLLPAIIAVL
jgi:hypothetical protein